MPYILKTSRTRVPQYHRIAVIRVRPGARDLPMISTRCRDAIEIAHEVQAYRHHKPTGEAFDRELGRAQSICAALNRACAEGVLAFSTGVANKPPDGIHPRRAAAWLDGWEMARDIGHEAAIADVQARLT